MMQGKLIVLEGIDGSCKSAKNQRLCERFGQEHLDFAKVSFPRSDTDSSALVRASLGAEFGSNLGDGNP